ncbi:RNase A-like domain-containing protein [Streptomyces sp. NPDC089799]|uniref:RNase A-like domain-containing protein n=1 Tax=Streptomyces sp. NPDC089799 TaxID=3155066 RepID=UPI0034255E89
MSATPPPGSGATPPPPGSGTPTQPPGGGGTQPAVPSQPSPAPGKLFDPDGKDISQGQPKPKPDPNKEVQAMKPSMDPGGWPMGFDVNPPHVWYTSYLIRNHQTAFHQAPRHLLDGLADHSGVCGIGSGPMAFARSYEAVTTLYLEVWAKAVAAVGGVSTGLTITANNYVMAEYASNPVLGFPTTLKPIPEVIQSPPWYGKVPDLAWRGGGDRGWSNGIINKVLGEIGELFHWVFQQALRKALRHGKVADITPGGDDKELPQVAAAWRKVADDAFKSGQDLDAAIGYLTNPDPAAANGEWQAAMLQFTSSLWGTRPWGKGPGNQYAHNYNWKHPTANSGARQPVLQILIDKAREIADILDLFKKEVEGVRRLIENEYAEAARECMELDSVKNAAEDIFRILVSGVVGLAEQFIENLDTQDLNAGVDRYNDNTRQLAGRLDALKPVLQQASDSVPTFKAEEARAQAVGARSITGFDPKHKWTVPWDRPTNHMYPIDLANQEDRNVGGVTHPIDRHVGLTEVQLQHRMRDQNPSAASTFPDLVTAQRLVQAAIDQKQNDITAKLLNDDTGQFTLKASFAEVTGKSVTSVTGHAQDVKSVTFTFKGVPNGHPPFVLITAYPDTP